jgi:hypothetical protein
VDVCQLDCEDAREIRKRIFERVAGVDLLGEPEFVGALDGDGPAGHDQVVSRPLANEVRDLLWPTDVHSQAHLRLGEGETGGPVGNSDVARDGEF